MKERYWFRAKSFGYGATLHPYIVASGRHTLPPTISSTLSFGGVG